MPLPPDVPDAIRDALAAQGIDSLYEHQAEVWDAAQRGEHVIVTTGTASGKTLAFNLPVLSALAENPKNRTLYLYPTKALAQDQVRGLGTFGIKGMRAAIYDGDTPSEQRWQVRKWSNLILSNPDMLHLGVLPHHDRWGDVLSNLRYVVVDEAHVYRGVFGSHVGNVLRRLRRLARVYGADPQFLFASATIANPGELARDLSGLDVTVVGDDAAPRAERTIALWNPPLLDEELGLRGSSLAEGSKLLAELVSKGLRALVFAKSRRAAELIHRLAAQRLGDGSLLSPYRAGYTPAQRREIEQRLFSGELLGVSATNALELGIDVGALDGVVSVGFPGTMASLRQQWGRAGRRGHGLAVLVATDDALDQYFMREPEMLLNRRVEAAISDHENPRVLDGHVAAAAFEAPLDEADAEILGPEALRRAAQHPDLKKTDAGYVWDGRDYPAGRFGLRSTSPDVFSVVEAESGSVLGAVEHEKAYSTVHEGAIYLHLGEQYRVVALDLASRSAIIEPFTGDYYTQAKKESDDRDRADPPRREPARARPRVRPRQRHRAGGRLPEEVDPRPGDDRARASRPPRDDVRNRGRLVRPGARTTRGPRADADPARDPARRRARDDRHPAALGDVRPLGHRRALDEHPLPDRPADDLRLRRPRRRRRDHRAWLRRLRGLGRGHGAHARGLPLRGRLPLVRAVPEVREPERAARQDGVL